MNHAEQKGERAIKIDGGSKSREENKKKEMGRM